MQFLLDNIVATFIAATVFLILAAVTVRSQQATVEATNHYGLKNQELNFVEMLKRDLHGASRVESVDEGASDSSFHFFAQMDNFDTTLTKISYQRTKVGMRDDVPLYQIIRLENGGPAGASMVTVTTWLIESRNSEGGKIVDPADAGQIYVRFEAAAPWREDDTVKRSRWEATFRPPLLRDGVLL